MNRRIGLLVALALAACGAPVDERARVAGVLHEDRAAAPGTETSASPPPLLQNEARLDAAALPLAPPAPRPDAPEPPRRQTTRSGPLLAAPPPRPEPPVKPEPAEPVVASVDPARLVGLGRSELADLMGTPSILRNEPPGELWLYKNASCVAHVYLYEKTGPEDYEVSYVEARGAKQAMPTGQCLAAFADEAASTVSLNEEPKN